jgi:hypothetical protein
MKLFKTLFFASLVIALMPIAVGAETNIEYAESVYQVSYQVLAPSNALGEPDSSYADFLDRDESVTLEFDNEVESDLTIHMYLLNYGAAARVDFYSESMELLDTSSIIFSIGETEVVFPYDGQGLYRYAKITSIEDEVWKLDAVEVEREIEIVVEEEGEEPEEVVVEEEVVRGQLVTLADDQNPTTHHDEAVYVLDANDQRHAFPSETIFFSWYEDFDDVTVIDATEMASYQLGKNVTMRPGTNLIKLTTDPNVYTVEPGSILRLIESETIAIDLYGDDWADRVRDVPDVFWGNYSVGDNIDSAVHPDGTLGVTPNGEVIYILNGSHQGMPGSVFSYMRFQPDFYTAISEELMELYVDVGNLTEDPEIAFPY